MLPVKGFWLHLPHFEWRLLMDDDTSQHFPNLLQLIESGTSGSFAPVGTAPLTEGIMTTGARPDESGIITTKSIRPDGYGIFDMCRQGVKKLFFWELLNHHQVKSSAINMLGTHFSSHEMGAITSDFYFNITDSSPSDWPMPIGAISDISQVEQMAGLRLHPSELSLDEIVYFFQNDKSKMDEFGIQHFARILCETLNVHSVVTQVAETGVQDFYFAKYPLLDNIAWYQKDSYDHSRPPYFHSAILIDQFIGRLMELQNTPCSIVVSAVAPRPFAIVTGPSVKKDELFDKKMGVYDLLPTVARVLGFSHANWKGDAFNLSAKPQRDCLVKLIENPKNVMPLSSQVPAFPPSRTQQKQVKSLELEELAGLVAHYQLMGDEHRVEVLLSRLQKEDFPIARLEALRRITPSR